jgi:hypothetical protein
MKLSRRFLHLALATLALAGLVVSRALWLAPMTMLWSSTARADNPIWAPYQILRETTCSGTTCDIEFPSVSTETLILMVSCNASMSTSTTVLAALATSNVLFTLPMLNYGTYNGNQLYETNGPTYAFVSPGNSVAVEAFSNSGTAISMQCTVSGYTRSKFPPLAETGQPPAAPLPPTPAGLPQSPGLPMFTRVPAQ